MFMDQKTQDTKLGVLQRIIDLMENLKGKGLKKPDAAIMTIEAKKPLEGSPEEEDGENPLEQLAEKSGKSPLDALGGDGGGEGSGDDEDELLKKLAAQYAGLK